MENNPMVTIVIPVYNGSDFLKKSIDSALAQTYKNIEIIIINDGSTDDGATKNIVSAYGDKIRYFEKSNGGVSSALNMGIKKMNGEYFSWLSHDDIYKTEKIKEQIEALKKTGNNNYVITSDSELIDEKGKVIGTPRNLGKKRYSSHEMFKLLFGGYSLNGCSLLIPKKVFNEVGLFDENLKYIQDWKMWVYITLANYKFLHIKNKLVQNRIHSEQQTVKIKDVLPKEGEEFTLQLINKLAKKPKENKDKIITILMFSKKNNSKILIENCWEALSNSGISLNDKIKIHLNHIINYPKNKGVNILKKYKQLWLRKSR